MDLLGNMQIACRKFRILRAEIDVITLAYCELLCKMQKLLLLFAKTARSLVCKPRKSAVSANWHDP